MNTPNTSKASIKFAGFTLVELAILLTIMSFVVVNALIIGSSNSETKSELATLDRLEKMKEALDQFALRNGHLPCPANGTLAIDDPNFGLPSLETNGTCWSVYYPDPTSSSAGLRVGIVPVKALGFGPEESIDSWGNRIMYVMNQEDSTYQGYLGSKEGTLQMYSNYIETGCPPSCSFTEDANGRFTFGVGSGGVAYTDPSILEPGGEPHIVQAGFVLISYGRNGIGAYPYNGSSTRNQASQFSSTGGTEIVGNFLELHNHHMYAPGSSGTFEFDNKFIKTDAAAEDVTLGEVKFDDIVVFSKKYDIVDAGKIISSARSSNAANNIPDSIPGLMLWLTPATMQTSSNLLTVWHDNYYNISSSGAAYQEYSNNYVSDFNNFFYDEAVPPFVGPSTGISSQPEYISSSTETALINNNTSLDFKGHMAFDDDEAGEPEGFADGLIVRNDLFTYSSSGPAARHWDAMQGAGVYVVGKILNSLNSYASSASGCGGGATVPCPSYWQTFVSRADGRSSSGTSTSNGRENGWGLGMACAYATTSDLQQVGFWSSGSIYHTGSGANCIPSPYVDGATDNENAYSSFSALGKYMLLGGEMNPSSGIRSVYVNSCNANDTASTPGQALRTTFTGSESAAERILQIGMSGYRTDAVVPDGPANWTAVTDPDYFDISGSLNGNMAEVIIYDNALTEFNRKKLFNYLNNKFVPSSAGSGANAVPAPLNCVLESSSSTSSGNLITDYCSSVKVGDPSTGGDASTCCSLNDKDVGGTDYCCMPTYNFTWSGSTWTYDGSTYQDVEDLCRIDQDCCDYDNGARCNMYGFCWIPDVYE